MVYAHEFPSVIHMESYKQVSQYLITCGKLPVGVPIHEFLRKGETWGQRHRNEDAQDEAKEHTDDTPVTDVVVRVWVLCRGRRG